MSQPRFSFIVRIWFELEPNLEGYAPALRGSVQRIGTEQVHYFHAIDKLIELLEAESEWQLPLPSIKGEQR